MIYVRCARNSFRMWKRWQNDDFVHSIALFLLSVVLSSIPLFNPFLSFFCICILSFVLSFVSLFHLFFPSITCVSHFLSIPFSSSPVFIFVQNQKVVGTALRLNQHSAHYDTLEYVYEYEYDYYYVWAFGGVCVNTTLHSTPLQYDRVGVFPLKCICKYRRFGPSHDTAETCDIVRRTSHKCDEKHSVYRTNALLVHWQWWQCWCAAWRRQAATTPLL